MRNIEGDFTDLKNIYPKHGGTIQGAAFLHYFISKTTD